MVLRKRIAAILWLRREPKASATRSDGRGSESEPNRYYLSAKPISGEIRKKAMELSMRILARVRSNVLRLLLQVLGM